MKQKLSKREFNNCIVYHDYVEHKKAIEFMCSSQVLLMLEVDDDESSYAIPAKLFDYFLNYHYYLDNLCIAFQNGTLVNYNHCN